MISLRRTRVALVAVTSTMVAIGVVMIYSASALYAQETYHDAAYFLKRHLLYLVLGVAGAIWMMRGRYHTLQRWTKPLVLLCVFLLLAVLVPGIGHAAGGARRWFRLGPLSVQPSQFAQCVAVLYLADALSRKQAAIDSFWEAVAPICAVIGALCLLIVVQPDLGTVIAIGAVTCCLFFAAKVRWQQLLSLGLATMPAGYMLLWRVPYRRRRILAFLNPWEDARGTGFQLVQSFLALGSGGVLGVGLGRSTQKLFYLPGAHTDFIFAIIGEELGFLGAAAVVILCLLFVILGMKIALHAPDLFGKFLAAGITSLIGIEALINLGVSMGAWPTKGLPLPFISYGGSALAMNLVAVGVLLNIAKDPV